MTITMKKYKFVSILSILAILLALNPISAFAAEPMEDITGHWAKDQIQSFVDSGHIKGYPDGTFKPDNNITRAEFMTIANNAFGYTEKAEIDYSDVADGSWYEDAIAIAKAAGYIAGYPDGTMKPDAPISRQEAAVIVAKIDALEANAAAADTFNDGTTIPAWSKGAIGACVTAEILNGYPDGSFLAKNLIKRGESVIALSKALDYKNTIVVTKTVTEISDEGFQLNLTPSVDGLTPSAVTLMQVDGNVTDGAINVTDGAINVTVTAITTENSGAMYAVTADLEEGKTYTLSLEKDGYHFGAEVTFTVVTDQQAADAVSTAIAALPATDELTLEDKAAVNTAKAAFDALTEEQSALVTAENKTTLDASIVKISELQAAADQAAADQTAADAVTAKISALPAPAELTLENKTGVDEAKAEYDALTEEQKALISAENQTKLSEAIAKIGELETETQTE